MDPRRRTALWLLTTVFLLAGSGGAILSSAQQQTPQPAADPRADIAVAVAKAGRDGKHVLLNFGADWCGDCRVLSALLKDPRVAKLVDLNVHVVKIDVGFRDQHMDLAATYEAGADRWIPALVVLDGKGARLTSLPVRTVTIRTTAE